MGDFVHAEKLYLTAVRAQHGDGSIMQHAGDAKCAGVVNVERATGPDGGGRGGGEDRDINVFFGERSRGDALLEGGPGFTVIGVFGEQPSYTLEIKYIIIVFRFHR